MVSKENPSVRETDKFVNQGEPERDEEAVEELYPNPKGEPTGNDEDHTHVNHPYRTTQKRRG
jgi:hypothetical protein